MGSDNILLAFRFEKNRKAIEEGLKKVNSELFKIKTYMQLRKKLGLSEKPEGSSSLDYSLNKVNHIVERINKGGDPNERDWDEPPGL